ncbi:NADP-dependent 3-hydroxy acid dehydrogenase YdfG [Litoreibacter ponti]|uniref:NADP-dependent 3-hydroxy acid dehydrogenase YdfG n=1 Tax=Litoreibacter ponti TaxID=1510457 RepID=A0A2T6BIW8_9RHOB|nr:SDR family oxidoreductase [Litoreibacter ponti]PTX55998.1 NADP-dependent 3-hydroxy acid dehydrogenase YdfG [Litoreibacter ponti]
MTEVAGKTVIITGASQGIGAATARHLAGLGANVALAARNADKLANVAAEIARDGGKALALPCDVADFDQVKELVTRANTQFGSVDILVNNAGLIDPIARIAESDPDAWGHVMDVNIKGVYHGIRAALPVMLAQGHGTIINISSGAATSALEGWSHYCASKAAVLLLTRVTDREYRDHGITCVGLSPGTVATEMQVQIKASGINPVSQLEPSDHIPPDWVARAIAWLAEGGALDHRGTDFSLKTDAGRAAVGLQVA